MQNFKRAQLDEIIGYIHTLPAKYNVKFSLTDYTMKEINELKKERDLFLVNCTNESLATLQVTDNAKVVFRIQS